MSRLGIPLSWGGGGEGNIPAHERALSLIKMGGKMGK